MLTAVERLMGGLKLTVNEQKTRCLRCPEELWATALGYRPHGKGAYIGTRGKASVRHMPQDQRNDGATGGWKSMEEMVEGLNRTMSGWANYFSLGQVSPAYNAVNRHTGKRLRQWLGRKHKTRAGRFVRYSEERLCADYSLLRLTRQTWPFRARRHDLVRKPDAGNPHVRFDERGSGNGTKGDARPGAKATEQPPPYSRVSPRLYRCSDWRRGRRWS